MKRARRYAILTIHRYRSEPSEAVRFTTTGSVLLIEVKWIAPGNGYTQAAQVRLAVFVTEQGYPQELEFDELDESAWHLVLLDGEVPVAAARLVTLSPGVLKPGRIAVLKKYRKQHLGARLMEEILKKAEELGARELRIGAQVQARGFYEKCGFSVCGEPIYMDVHIPHIDMIRRLGGKNFG